MTADTLDTTTCTGHTLVAPTGEIDLATAPDLRERIVEATATASSLVVVDLTGVSFLDSVGISVLVGGYRRLRADGRGLHLANPHPRVRRVLEVTRLVAVIPTFGSLAEAVSNCPRPHTA